MPGRGALRGACLVLLGALLVPAGTAAAQTVADPPPDTAPPTTTTPADPGLPPDSTVPSTPPSSVAPPPPFGLPMDTGRKLLEQRDRARVEIATWQPQLDAATSQRDELQQRWDGLTATLVRLDRSRQLAFRELGLARDRLGASAARAYVSSGSGRVGAALRAMTETDDVMQVTRDLHLISTYGDFELGRVDDYEARVADFDVRILDASEQRAEVRVRLDAAIATVEGLQGALADAQQRLERAITGIARFHKLAVGAGSPIRGPNRLNAAQLAEFIRRTGYTPRISVTIDELAQLYLDESAKVGIRGDVAWAQSILETGGFGFVGSMVEPEDNNYAGIGACDSCTRGKQFPDARTGVRAQMQLLRVYTDKTVTLDSLPDPIVMPGTLRLGFRGRVQSWWDLTGTWATAGDYGIRVYELYDRIVAETADVVAPPAPPALPVTAPIDTAPVG